MAMEMKKKGRAVLRPYKRIRARLCVNLIVL